MIAKLTPTTTPALESALEILRWQRQMEATYDINVSALHVLCLLADGEDTALQMSTISKLLKISTAGMTGLVDKLENKGLVERVQVEGDRRAIGVVITEGGRLALA